ncbi:hypothetical protein LTR53_002168 [Teratosphaeriaceae sp. CCFEE 6253]|nr:hypothetical protein LTR53_002168 [Teratosphaeriaceae sp. CCFEE 6253]
MSRAAASHSGGSTWQRTCQLSTDRGRIVRRKNHLVTIRIGEMDNVEPSLQHFQPTADGSAELAPQACSSCRKQKRKCDKRVPSCSLCIRIGRACDYTEDSHGAAPSPEDFTALRQEVAELRNLLARGVPFGASTSNGSGTANGNGSSERLSGVGLYNDDSSPPSILAAAGKQSAWQGAPTFPSLFYLDSNAFEYERFQIQAPYIQVPPGALTGLGSSHDLRQLIEHYFGTVHSYFPIISKIRLYQHLANPMHEPSADIALLFLAMQLSCSDLAENQPPQTQLYQDLKSFYSYIESQNGFSIQAIQALLLISLYELGHAIYPAAYLTIGHAARLGHAMGIHERGTPQMLQRPTTWTEQEERRRVWWGVIILDRFVSIGNRGKPCASADPSLDIHLPTDDASWDKGQMLVAAPLALSASQAIRAAPFARTCQAAHLLGKVVQHLDDKSLTPDYKFNEALRLNRTFRALAAVLPEEAEADDSAQHPTLCTSMAICYSALLTLYDSYSCTERAIPNGPEEQLLMQKESVSGLQELSATVMHLAGRVRGHIDSEGLDRLSPLTIDCFYQAAANYAWYVRESSDPACGEKLAELKELLRIISRKWRVAGEYLQIIEATEFAMASAIH